MILDEPTRNRILIKLKEAGWLSEFSVLADDKTPHKLRLRIQWTDYGKQRRKIYHSIFEELAFPGSGDLEALHDICLISPFEDMGEAGEAPPRQPRL